VTGLWRVRKPSVDGIITRYEGFDAEGEQVIPLFGVRKQGIPRG
jgi:putative hemin transport protein